jgi:hypothetical protein
MAAILRTFAMSLIGFSLFMSRAAAQQSSETSIAKMSPAEVLTAAASASDPESRAELSQRAAELFLTTELMAAEGDYASLVSMFKLALPELTPGDKFRLAGQLSERSDGEALAYQSLRQKLALMYLAGVPLAQRAAEVAAWIEADQTGFAGVLEAEYAWLYNSLAEPQLKHGTFSVEWSGRLSAPRTGDYVLSISPINVNATWEKFYIRTYCVIEVAGKEVLKSSPDHWVTETSPIQLTANQPVDISVAASFEVSRPAIDAIHAMLFWKGPGTAKQVVPQAAFSTAEGQPGLDAKYSVTLAEGAKIVERIDPAIDFAWTTDRRVVAGHEQAMKKLREQIWRACMSPEYLAGCEEAASPRHRHPFLYDLLLVECLTSEQRQAFLDELQNRPAMLERLTPAEAIRFFRAFRFGVEDAALDAYGLWAKQHANLQSAFPSRPDQQAYFDVNRMEFHDLARCVYQQSPEQAKRLESEFLTAEDGSCVLPVAYTLAYCYQDSGRINEWMKLIDERLADAEVAGDARVNWFLARAMIDEIAGLDASFFTGSNENLMAGWRWLGEAERAAQSPAAKARVIGELIAREAALGQFEGAKRRLDDAKSGVLASDPSSASWKGRLDEIAKLALSREEQADAAAAEGYRAEMRRRQRRAADRGDDVESARIEQLVGETESGNQQ